MQFCLLVSLAVVIALCVGECHACTAAAKDEPEEFEAEELHYGKEHPNERISIQCRPEIERSKDDDGEEGDNIVTDHCIQEYETE